MGSSTAQLAMSLVLRFTDHGSSGAAKAIDGVQQALNNVTKTGTRTAETAARVDRSMRGMGASNDAAGRGLQISGSHLLTWLQRAAGAAAASNSVARGLDGVSSSSAAAARGAEQVARQASAATQALNSMSSAASKAASAGAPLGGASSAGSGSGGRRIGSIVQGGMAVATGATAAGMVLAGPVRETMSYERKLAHLANTGTPDGSLAERQASMQMMDAGIMDAVRRGGGSREGAMATLDKMVASGAYKSPQEALKDLPALVKAGTASGADPAELADIAIKARQTMGITDMDSVLNKAMKAGQLGGFELKDMAKWLPKQMALAKRAGLSGESGLTAILAANQAAVVTSGTKDEAGNNLVNLLNKVNSNDTANDAKKLGIDLSGSLAKARSKGVNGLDAFVNLVEQVVAKDSKFQDLSRKAKNAKGDDQKAMYDDMAEIMKGSSIGKLIQDQQALLALIGIMQQRTAQGDGNTGAMRGSIDKAQDQRTIGNAHDLIASTADYKAQTLVAEKANAMQQAMGSVNPLLGKMADWLTGAARDYPTLTTATVAASTALTALASAAGAASLAQMLGGGGGAGGIAKAVLPRLLGGLLGGVGVGAAWEVGQFAGGQLYDQVAGTGAIDKLGELEAGLMAFFGNKTAQDALASNRQIEAAQAMKEAAEALKNARPSVHLDGRQLDAELQDVQNFQARRR